MVDYHWNSLICAERRRLSLNIVEYCWISLNIVDYCWISLTSVEYRIVEHRWISLILVILLNIVDYHWLLCWLSLTIWGYYVNTGYSWGGSRGVSFGFTGAHLALRAPTGPCLGIVRVSFSYSWWPTRDFDFLASGRRIMATEPKCGSYSWISFNIVDYRINACKTQHKRWISCIPRHQSWYPDITSMRVKHNKQIEFISSLGINHGTLISPQCV